MTLFKNKKNNSGFTLIELLVVISIISLLSSIVLSSVNTARARARDTQRIMIIKQLQNALELYRSDKGLYPDGYGVDIKTGTTFADTLKSYIPSIPNDPTNDGWQYAVIGTSKTAYELAVHFEDTAKYFTLIPSGSGTFLDRCMIAVGTGLGAEWGLGNNPCKNISSSY